jgi:hypothetical protein
MMMSPKLDVAVPEVLEILAAIELQRHHGFVFGAVVLRRIAES